MNEQEQKTLKVFFDGIEAHINEFLRYMEEENKESIDRKHIERFLNDVKYEVVETRKDINFLSEESN